MAAARQSPAVEQRARAGWLRRFGPTAAQIVGAVLACTLWTGVASPGLKLLPGLDGLADESIAISLQSAVLGIDDGSNRPAEERARDAAAVLGLTYAESLLSPTAVRAGAAARANGTAVPARRVARRDPRRRARNRVPRSARRRHEPVVNALPEPSSARTPAVERTPAPAAPRPRRRCRRQPFPSLPPIASRRLAGDARSACRRSSSARVHPRHAVVGGTYVVSASASSGLPVRYSIVGKKDVCRISGSTVSFRGVGTCVVEAEQPGSAKYKEARALQAFASFAPRSRSRSAPRRRRMLSSAGRPTPSSPSPARACRSASPREREAAASARFRARLSR